MLERKMLLIQVMREQDVFYSFHLQSLGEGAHKRSMPTVLEHVRKQHVNSVCWLSLAGCYPTQGAQGGSGRPKQKSVASVQKSRVL